MAMRPSVSPPEFSAINWAAIRADFPVLRREIDGARIVYLDSANTSQKPQQVIDAMSEFMAHDTRRSIAPPIA
jgi:cysteine desulfurase / selenocysteine lyase